MLKKIFLKLRTRYWIKNSKVKRHSVPFEKAEKVGVLISNKDPKCLQQINDFIKKLAEEGKEIKVLCNPIRPVSSKYEFDFVPVTKKDISWNGTFKTRIVKKFIKTEFDYLFSINTSSFLPFENILAISHAKCRIGSWEPGKKALLEMIVYPGKEPNKQGVVNQMLYYAKKIK